MKPHTMSVVGLRSSDTCWCFQPNGARVTSNVWYLQANIRIHQSVEL